MVLNQCLFCNTDTTNKKYCSKICSNKDLWKKGILGKDVENMTKGMHEANVGKKRTEKTKNKISSTKLMKSKLGLYNKWNPWTKGLTKKSSEKINEMSKKISLTKKENGCNQWLKDEEKLKKMSIKVSESLKKKFSLGILIPKSGKDHPMFGKTHTPEAVKKIFAFKKMNQLEQKVADILKNNNIEYYFQFFISKNNKVKSYDFKIKGLPIILEINGDFWHGNPLTENHFFKVEDVKKNDLEKINLAKEKNLDVITIWESEIKKDENIVINKLLSTLKEKNLNLDRRFKTL